jgi:hypothetical protein
MDRDHKFHATIRELLHAEIEQGKADDSFP